MSITFHSLVQRDFRRALIYYQEVAGDKIAERFEAVLRDHLQRAVTHPKHFHYDRGGLRRVNLKGFPWHFLFRERVSAIFVLVLRHDNGIPIMG